MAGKTGLNRAQLVDSRYANENNPTGCTLMYGPQSPIMQLLSITDHYHARTKPARPGFHLG